MKREKVRATEERKRMRETDDMYDTLRIRIEGDVNHFDSNNFLSSASRSFEINPSRLMIVGLRSGR